MTLVDGEKKTVMFEKNDNIMERMTIFIVDRCLW